MVIILNFKSYHGLESHRETKLDEVMKNGRKLLYLDEWALVNFKFWEKMTKNTRNDLLDALTFYIQQPTGSPEVTFKFNMLLE